MVRRLMQRLGQSLLALWGLLSVVFLLSHRAPGGPETDVLPETGASTTEAGPAARAAARLALRRRLALDEPLFYVRRAAAAGQPPRWQWQGRRNQYHRWLTALAGGDLGQSGRTGQPVAAMLGAALRFTLPVSGLALVGVLGAALLLGRALAGPGRWWQPLLRAGLVGLHSVPLFVVALGLLLLFANPEVLAWFPLFADDEPAVGAGAAPYFGAYLLLPVLSLVLVALPGLALQLEAALRHALATDYARTARAKGQAERRIISRHALPNALLPTITQLTELLPTLVAGALVVEVVFALPGMGRLLVQAATLHDYPVLLGGVLLVGAVRLAALLLADALYWATDPRMR